MTSALVVSRIFPYTPQMVHGVFQRFGNQVEALGRVVDQIECLFLTPSYHPYTPEEVEEHRQRLTRQYSTDFQLTVAPVETLAPVGRRWLEYGAGIFNFYCQPIARELNNPQALGAVETALSAKPDLIIAHKLSAMSTLLQLKKKTRGAPIFFDLDDIEHLTAARRLWHKPSFPGEQIKLLHIPRLLLAEIEAVKLARRTLICSAGDHRYLGRYVDKRRLEVVPNSIRFPDLDTQDRSEPVVLFVGSMTYEPNALAADALVRDVWPTIIQQVPQARLVIAGINPERIPSFTSAPPSVTFTGFVDDLSEIYAKSRVVCCPILYGGGTRIKIIEAAAFGRAVVSTPLAAEGLDFRQESEILIRDEPEQLARECVRLLRNPQEAQRVGAAARERARSTYDRKAVLTQLEHLYRDGLGRSR